MLMLACLFGELRLSIRAGASLAPVVIAESAAACNRAASPSANEHCQLLLHHHHHLPTATYHRIAPLYHPLPPHLHRLTHMQEPTLITPHQTSHNTANMVLEATMIVYVPLSREAPTQSRIHGSRVTATNNTTVWTTPNPLVTATTYLHAGRRKPMPPTSSSTARPKQTPSQASVS